MGVGEQGPIRLTPQLDTVIIEVSPVKGLSLRGNPLRLYRAKHYSALQVSCQTLTSHHVV